MPSTPTQQHLLIADFGHLGREGTFDPAYASREEVVRIMAEGQCPGQPIQVIAFDIVAGTSGDVSVEIARELLSRFDDTELPAETVSFISMKVPGYMSPATRAWLATPDPDHAGDLARDERAA